MTSQAVTHKRLFLAGLEWAVLSPVGFGQFRRWMNGGRGDTFAIGSDAIAIARALLLDPRILVFDEATSALDAESEEIIQQNMARITSGRTVIVIAHRMSALRFCRRIIGLQNGEVVEDGTPEELLRQTGPFARFARKQLDSMRHSGQPASRHAHGAD